MVVIGVTVAVTLSVSGNRDDGGQPFDGTSSATDGVVHPNAAASAEDTGPVAVIVEDPSCAAQRPIFATLADEAKKGWNDRDATVPATEWTAGTRTMFEAYAAALSKAADQLVPLAKLTPHRAMRELYEQFIAYSRVYVDRIATYTQSADYSARVGIAISDAISNICAAVDYGSAAARGPLIAVPAAPSSVPPVGDLTNPSQFMPKGEPICGEWGIALSQFQNDVDAWRKTNPDIPAGQWTPEQKAINDQVAPIMERYADELAMFADRSGNLIVQDFANLASQYRKAYVAALPSYTPADKYLATASIRLVGVVQGACQAVDG